MIMFIKSTLVIMRRKILLMTLVLIIPIAGLFSQDFHYSQFYNEPLNFNPSLAGVMDGNRRVVLSLRDQYRTVPVPYTTFSGSYDMKFIPKTPKHGYFSGGVVFNYDKQGDAKFTVFNLNLAGSYTLAINRKNFLTGGGLLGYNNRGFSEGGLRWDRQYDPVRGIYDPGRDPGEKFESYRFGYLETGLGINYRYQHTERTNLIVGGSVFHLNTPSQNFINVGTDKLDMRFALLAMANIKIIDNLDFQANVLYQQQGVYKEKMLGGIAKIYINKKRGKQLALHLGVLGRLGEGWAPKLAVEYNEFYLSMNYDIPTKLDLSDITNYRGGPELHFRYLIKNVAPLREFKICPIY